MGDAGDKSSPEGVTCTDEVNHFSGYEPRFDLAWPADDPTGADMLFISTVADRNHEHPCSVTVSPKSFTQNIEKVPIVFVFIEVIPVSWSTESIVYHLSFV